MGSQAKREHRGALSPVASAGLFAVGEIPVAGALHAFVCAFYFQSLHIFLLLKIKVSRSIVRFLGGCAILTLGGSKECFEKN